MYDFKQDFTDYQKLVPNADLTVKTPPTGTTEPQGYDFTQDFESYRKIAPDMSGLESVNDPLIKKAQIAQQKQEEEDKKKLQLAADLQLQSGYTPTPESVSSAQMTEGAKKSLAGMQDKILGKAGVITQRFGNRNSIEKFSGGVNYGTDIGVPKGTKVSVPPGKWKVIEAFGGAEEGKQAANRGYGNSILVQNQETGEKLRFSHLQDVGVKPGEIVDGNKIVGTVGLTGNTTGPHLDLEMYDRSGRLIDILETPYSSYLGLGQGGGSGKGGGNPMMDKITQVGRDVIGAVADTPVLPFLPQVTPRSLLTRPPGTFTALDPGSYYGNFKQDPKRAMMDTVMALSTGPQAKSSLNIDQIDDAIDVVRGRIGSPDDQITALRDIEKFAEKTLDPKELKIAKKSTDNLIDSIIGKFQDPIDIKKAKIAKELSKPSTGGEIGGGSEKSIIPNIDKYYNKQTKTIDDNKFISDAVAWLKKEGKINNEKQNDYSVVLGQEPLGNSTRTLMGSIADTLRENPSVANKIPDNMKPFFDEFGNSWEQLVLKNRTIKSVSGEIPKRSK